MSRGEKVASVTGLLMMRREGVSVGGLSGRFDPDPLPRGQRGHTPSVPHNPVRASAPPGLASPYLHLRVRGQQGREGCDFLPAGVFQAPSHLVPATAFPHLLAHSADA